MLAREVADRYQGRVEFVSENFGESELARRFGVTRYPAIFVDDVLVARPIDFGFFAKGETAGRYTPFRDPKSHARFQADLARMIDLVLTGRKEDLRAERSGEAPAEIASLPVVRAAGLSGEPLQLAELKGKVVLVEFWATWCPPCRSTLQWLGELKKQYGDKLEVVAFAVESPDDQVRSLVAQLSPEVRWAIASPELAREFGDVSAVPTLFVFDGTGRTARIAYGAPPDLHETVGKLVAELTQR